MKIDPFFLQKPKELDLNTDIKTRKFKIIGIAKVGRYRLCRWTYGAEEKISGEILYFNKKLLKVGGGALFEIENLKENELNKLSNFQQNSLEETINQRFKNTDLPRSLILSLYNEENYTKLD